ncbi:MAG: helix-turn-helix domain-containing protein [Candidatus Riflebacteria bacterium]|nr:helix-turn-helix domain-containing protein [Candidatus Riflebacteria bacterium]
MSFKQKLKALILEKEKFGNFSQSELARQMGVARSTISQYVLGKTEPNFETIKKIASFFDVQPGYFLDDDPDVPEGWVKVPVIGRVPAGIAIEAIEEFEGEMLVPAHEYKPGQTFGLRVVGDSMEPSILAGDCVIVDRLNKPDNGDVVVCRVNCYGEVTLKRFFQEKNIITLRPDNNRYPPITIIIKESCVEESDNDIHILGKVTLLTRKKI